MRRWACGLLATAVALACVRGAEQKTLADNERQVAEQIAALKSKDAAARKDAAGALTAERRVPAAAAPPLGEALLDDDLDVRQEAARALIGIGRPAVAVLVGVLKEKDRNARKLAVQALGELGSRARSALPQLMNLVKNDGDKAVRIGAAFALGRMGTAGNAAVSVLTTALKDADADLRGTAAVALGEIGPGAKGAVPALTEALKDENQYVRSSAAYGLGGIGRDAVASAAALSESLKDKEPTVRRFAASALGRIGPVRQRSPRPPSSKC